MFRSHVTLLLLSFTPTLFAQSIIDFSQLPQCASTCYALNTAQSLCIPPKAPSSSQQTYDTCFCNSNFLTNFASDAAAICDPPCTAASDRTAIQNWFNNFCKTGADAGAATTSTAAATATTTTSAAVASETSPTLTSASTGNQTWWSLHARWVAMAIVLIVGFSIITVVGVLLKRRYNRKRDRAGASSSAAFWGPNTNQHVSENLDQRGNMQEKSLNSTAQSNSKRLGKVNKVAV